MKLASNKLQWYNKGIMGPTRQIIVLQETEQTVWNAENKQRYKNLSNRINYWKSRKGGKE